MGGKSHRYYPSYSVLQSFGKDPISSSVFTILFITQGPKPNDFPSKFPKYISYPLVSYNGVLEWRHILSGTVRGCFKW